jgi:hypothetical protein
VDIRHQLDGIVVNNEILNVGTARGAVEHYTVASVYMLTTISGYRHHYHLLPSASNVCSYMDLISSASAPHCLK